MTKKEITLNNGESIAYLEKGKGEKTLLLIHGNFSSALHFTPLFSRIPDDIKVIAPDLRGFGDSSYHQSIDTLKDFSDDLADFLKLKGIQKVDVIGWSMGGGVAMEFAANHKEMTNTLTLINSTTHKGYPVFKKDPNGAPKYGEIYATKAEMAQDPIQVVPLLMAISHKDFNTMSYIWNLTIYTMNKPNDIDNKMWIDESLKQRNLVDVDWAIANYNMSDGHNLYQQGTNTIAQIEAKTLHIWGTKDIVVPAYMAQENILALKDQSTYIAYENCGHSPLVDVPDKLTDDILTFIKS